MDSITINGIPGLDGEYTHDVLEMVTVGAPGCLTNREVHQIKVRTGLRLPEIVDALLADDNDIFVALAEVALRRLGKRFDPDALWDARLGAVLITLASRPEVEPSPPQEAPTQIGAPKPSGGTSSEPSSASPENDPSPTGSRDSARSATSDPLTLVS